MFPEEKCLILPTSWYEVCEIELLNSKKAKNHIRCKIIIYLHISHTMSKSNFAICDQEIHQLDCASGSF